MRLDLFLKLSRLIVRRSVAQEVCQAGAVMVNDSVAKPSREIRSGDVIALRQRGRLLTVRVLMVPQSKTLRTLPAELYEIMAEQRLTDDNHLN